jgi:hypothetical protein
MKNKNSWVVNGKVLSQCIDENADEANQNHNGNN